jgi:hypothetical protein
MQSECILPHPKKVQKTTMEINIVETYPNFELPIVPTIRM